MTSLALGLVWCGWGTTGERRRPGYTSCREGSSAWGLSGMSAAGRASSSLRASRGPIKRRPPSLCISQQAVQAPHSGTRRAADNGMCRSCGPNQPISHSTERGRERKGETAGEELRGKLRAKRPNSRERTCEGDAQTGENWRPPLTQMHTSKMWLWVWVLSTSGRDTWARVADSRSQLCSMGAKGKVDQHIMITC